jgi:hypothetical protein
MRRGLYFFRDRQASIVSAQSPHHADLVGQFECSLGVISPVDMRERGVGRSLTDSRRQASHVRRMT